MEFDKFIEMDSKKDLAYHEMITTLIRLCDKHDTIPNKVVMELVEKSLTDMRLIIDEFNSLVKR